MMNIAKCMLVGGAVMLTAATFAAELEHVSSGEVRVGEWNTNFAVAKQYAEANQLPLLAFFSNPGCAKCNKMKEACNTAEFLAWQQSVNMVFAFGEGDPQVKNFTRNSSGQYPYLRLYWPAGGVDISFSGRSGSIPASGSTLQAQLMSAVSKYVSGDVPVGPVAPTPVIGSEWNSSRKIYGTVRDGRGLIVGRLELTLGKVSKSGSKKGQAKASAKLMGLDGKSKSFRAGYCTVNSETVVSLNGAAGSLQVTVSGNSFSGAVNGMTADTAVVTGGDLPDGDYRFAMDYLSDFGGYPVLTQFLPTFHTPLNFTVVSSKWRLASKATIKWNRESQQFYASRVGNEAGMKFSYNRKTGLFKGTFKIYTTKRAGSKTANSAKATGFVSAAGGNGIVVVKKASFNCEIAPAK